MSRLYEMLVIRDATKNYWLSFPHCLWPCSSIPATTQSNPPAGPTDPIPQSYPNSPHRLVQATILSHLGN